MREYIWLPEAEIAPTMGSRAQVDRPLATVEAVNTVSPIHYYVHVDHLHRPARMTNTAKAVVWDAVWLPFGGLHSVSGLASLNARFPGQWFQAETGLHYNWHRSYDPSLGRFTQPDPLGFVDGPSVYEYAGSSPQTSVDPAGEFVPVIIGIGGGLLFEYVLDKSCGCPSSASSYAASAAAGGSISDFVSPVRKEKVLGGSSDYKSRQSEALSKLLKFKLKRRLPAPTLRRPFSKSINPGIVIGRALPIISAAYFFVRIRNCVMARAATGE